MESAWHFRFPAQSNLRKKVSKTMKAVIQQPLYQLGPGLKMISLLTFMPLSVNGPASSGLDTPAPTSVCTDGSRPTLESPDNLDLPAALSHGHCP